jgi:hypothetical protein
VKDKKIGIATVTTGLNYGTSLQAFSTKYLLKKLTYEAEILKLKGSLIKNRDIRLSKMLIMVFRSLLYKKNLYKIFFRGKKKSVTNKTKNMFADFNEKYLQIKSYKWSELKKIGKDKNYIAFLCGSDQVWNGTTLYPDPLYYLEFSPEDKRIAFSPSFGCSEIPTYNKKIISKKISKFSAISTREESGCMIIKELTGAESICLVDPTLMLCRKEWSELFSLENRLIKSDYILVYFLDEPTDKAKKYIKNLKEKLSIEIIGIPYDFVKIVSDRVVDAGPKQFLNLIYNAKFVVTDSFHGTAFSLNFRTPFATFERDYGVQTNQSSRITSLLTKINKINRFEPDHLDMDENIDIDLFLETERDKAVKYLNNSI